MHSHKKQKKKGKKKSKKQEDDYNELFPEDNIDNAIKDIQIDNNKKELHQSSQLQNEIESSIQTQTSPQIPSQAHTQATNITQPSIETAKADKPASHINYNQLPVISSTYTDSDNSEDEGMEYYKKGGYHPVHIGEVLLDRYIIMQKLGWGHFSTVWLSRDMKYNTYVAIKIQKSSQHYLDAAYDEVEILQELYKHNYDPEWIESINHYWQDSPSKTSNGIQRDHSQIVQLLNSFIHHGPNGKHFCMVFEIMGITLLEIIKRFNYKGIPIPYVRIIAKQILIGLDFLHRMCGIIHTDLKPENVLVCLTPDELKEIEESGSLHAAKKKNIRSLFKTTSINNNNREEDDDALKLKNTSKIEQLSLGNQQSLMKDSMSMSMSDNNDGYNNNSNSNTNTSTVLTGKKKRKKNQKFQKAQAKKLKKMGLSQEEITKALNKIKESKKENGNDNSNYLQFQISNIADKEGMINSSKCDFNEQMSLSISISIPKQRSKSSSNNEQRKATSTCIIPMNHHLKRSSKSLLKDIKERRELLGKIINAINQKRRKMPKGIGIDTAAEDIEIEAKRKRKNENENEKEDSDDIIKVKICDMGNACWFNHHFSTEIQTRQYRSPEVILGVNYNESADLWSFACIIFELVTGDFLFDPKVGDTYTKNDDHLAQIIELLGKMPKKFALSGLNSKKYFNKDGNMIRIKGLQYWPLPSVLMKKYKINGKESQALNDFLMPMLEYYPEKRASAQSMLNHPWLTMPPNYDYHMNDLQYEGMLQLQKREKKKEEEKIEKDTVESDEEKNMADNEDNSNYSSNEDNLNDTSVDYDTQDMIMLQNFNNSFTAYGQHIDLAILDRANPQFNANTHNTNNTNSAKP